MANKETKQQVKDALTKAIREKKLSQDFLTNLGPAVIETLRPVLDEIATNSKLSKDELLSALSQIKIDVPKADVPKAEVTVTMPEVRVPTPQVTVNVADIPAPIIPEIKIPKITVPKPEVTVNVPPFPKIPKLEWPSESMPIEGWVRLQGIDLSHPLPVQLRDAKGNQIDLSAGLTQVTGGGVAARVVKVSGMPATTGVVTINPDGNPIYVSAGLTDTELRASSVDVQQASGATWSVSVNDVFRTTVATNLINSEDRLRVSVETGSSGLTDAELRASAVPVIQVTGSVWSVSVNDAFRTTVASNLINADDRLRVSVETGGGGLTDAELRAASVPVSQVTGSVDSVNVLQWAGVATGSGDERNASTLKVMHVGDAGVS